MSNVVAGVITRTLSFDWYIDMDNDDAELQVQYRCDSVSSWSNFGTSGTFNRTLRDGENKQVGFFKEELPCDTDNTQVRFVNTGTSNKKFYFDNVDVSWENPGTPQPDVYAIRVLVDDLILPANGAISVTAYLSVTAGFIDLNDTVQMEAIVKDDGATVVTLDNPTVTPLLPPVLSEYEDTFPTIGSYGGTTGRTTWVPDRTEEARRQQCERWRHLGER